MRAPAFAIGFVLCVALGLSQSERGSTPGSASFEVASVKPSPPIRAGDRVFFGPPRGGPGTPDPSRITWTYASLKAVLMKAYEVETYQVSGPDWLNTERYDIAATVPSGSTRDQVNRMWQNLLKDRFGLVLHHEPREFKVEELVLGKKGPKLKESNEDPNAPPPDGPPVVKNGELAGPGLVTMIRPGPRGSVAHSIAKAQPVSKLTTMLGNALGRPVLDRTGLTGRYDFALDFTLDTAGLQSPAGPGTGPADPNPAVGASDPGSDLVTAVEQQLGLRLVAGKANLDVLVIDRADRVPAAN